VWNSPSISGNSKARSVPLYRIIYCSFSCKYRDGKKVLSDSSQIFLAYFFETSFADRFDLVGVPIQKVIEISNII